MDEGAEVFLDGGIRRGVDVVKALALGGCRKPSDIDRSIVCAEQGPH